jgi:cytochrome c oxidase assembly protein subunit 15
MRALRRITGLALVLTFGLILLGAWVRATNSGLSCPDWPTCYGHWLPLPGEIPPEAGYSYLQVMLEWTHRLLAGVILGPLVLIIGGLAWRARAQRPRLPLYGAALILLLLVQASLGGLTVLDQNSPWSVALHLGTALVLFSVLWLIFVRSGTAREGAPAARPRAVLTWLLALGAMASAAMMTTAARRPPGRAAAQGSAPGGPPGDRQDAARAGDRGRGERAVLLDLGLRLRGDVRGCRRQPRARPL